jgi:hypothetical protein
MARIVFLWTRPYHASAEEAEAWARREAAHLLELDGVERAELTRLDGASSKHVCEWDWMLELHLRDGFDAHRCVDDPALADWLLDLRLLGTRPVAMVVQDSTALAPEGG